MKRIIKEAGLGPFKKELSLVTVASLHLMLTIIVSIGGYSFNQDTHTALHCLKRNLCIWRLGLYCTRAITVVFIWVACKPWEREREREINEILKSLLSGTQVVNIGWRLFYQQTETLRTAKFESKFCAPLWYCHWGLMRQGLMLWHIYPINEFSNGEQLWLNDQSHVTF